MNMKRIILLLILAIILISLIFVLVGCPQSSAPPKPKECCYKKDNPSSSGACLPLSIVECVNPEKGGAEGCCWGVHDVCKEASFM